jgi:hypothetical protein
VNDPISDKELAEVRARESGYWDGTIVRGLVARIDQLTADHGQLRAELAFAMQRIAELATENAGLRKRLAVGGWQG